MHRSRPAAYRRLVPTSPRFELTVPDVRRHASWLEAAAEFAATGEFAHGSGLTPDGEQPRPGRPAWRPGELTDPARFAAFVADLHSLTDPDVVRPIGMVPDTKLWITDGERYLGAVSIRHELNDFLLQTGGHIGYSVRPSSRRQGLATAALRRALVLAGAAPIGLTRALVTCEEGNAASAGVIERCGGVLEDVRGIMRRYWIAVTPDEKAPTLGAEASSPA